MHERILMYFLIILKYLKTIITVLFYTQMCRKTIDVVKHFNAVLNETCNNRHYR